MIDGLERTISVLEDIDRTPYLKELCRLSGKQLADQRYQKFRQIGEMRKA